MSWWLAEQVIGGRVEVDAMDCWVTSSLVLGVSFTLVTAMLTIFDLWSPPWWRATLLRSTKFPPTITLSRISTMMPTYFRNVVASGIYVWLLWNLRILVSEKPPSFILWIDANVWAPLSIFHQLLVIHCLSQLWFWCAHRYVHSVPALYKWIHAAHHAHTEPFALTAIDCTVSEMIVLNIPAVIFPLLLLKPSLLVQNIWVVLAALHVPLAHSSHSLRHLADASHVIHHRDPRFNFGSTTLDRLFNTLKTE